MNLPLIRQVPTTIAADRPRELPSIKERAASAANRLGITDGRYRCEPHWRTLLDWLEENGISARKKVHELRKLFG